MLAEIAKLSLVERLAALDIPTQAQTVDYLAQMPLLACIPLALLGVVYLLMGWKYHKAIVILNAAACGAGVGGYLGEMAKGTSTGAAVFGAVAGAITFAVLAWPLMRGAVSLFGVLIGGLVGAIAWCYASKLADAPNLANSAWAGAAIGMVALGLLAYANFRLTVILFTTIQGALMTLAGAIGVLIQQDYLNENIRWAADHNVHMLASLVFVPTIIGLAIQHVSLAKKGGKKPAPSPA